MKKSLFLLAFLFLISNLNAQLEVLNKLKNKIENKIDQKTDEAIDSLLEDGTKQKSSVKANQSKSQTSLGVQNNTSDASIVDETSQNPQDLKSYRKFDFVPGEKIIAFADFSNLEIGDFPADWNTNSSADLATVEGKSGKWLVLDKAGTFLPEAFNLLPENFTFEFDLICNKNFSYFSSGLHLVFTSMKKPAQEFMDWREGSHGSNGSLIMFHPSEAGGSYGRVYYSQCANGEETPLKNEIANESFYGPVSNYARVSVWRQKGRLRVYLNAEKVLDLPRLMDTKLTYNGIVFYMNGNVEAGDKYLISNLKLAVGQPDTRSKLITEGKLVTRGIVFDSGSDVIKQESYGTVKDIAQVLKENASVKVKVIGHTDNVGKEDANLSLSKKRAEAVKKYLETEFGIGPDRVQTDGKGAKEPTDDNSTTQGRANNRRVEFLKIN